MKSKFQVGDEFSYTDSGNKGTILKVLPMNGTVLAKYSNYGSEHVLAENLLTNLTRPEPLLMLGDKTPPPPSVDFEDHDTRTNQLVNELYHDRARLENLVKHAAELAREAATALQDLLNKDYGATDQEQSDELVAVIIAGSKLGEFAEANE